MRSHAPNKLAGQSKSRGTDAMTDIKQPTFPPWWQWAVEWDEARSDLPHGEIETALAKFCVEKPVGPTRLRRASAARAAATRFEADGLVGAAVDIARLPLDDVEVLVRLRRYGLEVVQPVLELALAGMTGRNLLKKETEARAQLGLEPSPALAKNSHAHRLTANLFRERAVRLVTANARNRGEYLSRTATFAGSVPIDAVLTAPDCSRFGVRLVAATPGGDVRARQRDILLYAIAAARFFTKVIVIFQREADAVMMTSTLVGLGHTGVEVAWYDPADNRFVWLSKSGRRRSPDLAASEGQSARTV